MSIFSDEHREAQLQERLKAINNKYETECKIREAQWQKENTAREEQRQEREKETERIWQERDKAYEMILEKLLKSFQTVHENVTPIKCPQPDEKQENPASPEHKTGNKRKKSKSQSKTANCKFQSHKCAVHEKKSFSNVLSFYYLGQSNKSAGLNTHLNEHHHTKTVHKNQKHKSKSMLKEAENKSSTKVHIKTIHKKKRPKEVT